MAAPGAAGGRASEVPSGDALLQRREQCNSHADQRGARRFGNTGGGGSADGSQANEGTPITSPSTPRSGRVATQPTSATPRVRSILDASDSALARVLLAPAFLLLLLIVVYPVCRLLWTSVLDLRLSSGMPARFAGIDNYTAIFTDPEFWTAL